MPTRTATVTVTDAVHQIGRRLGVDAYGVFENQKHLIDYAIVGAIALALLKDYLAGFLDLKKTGQAHRAYLGTLIQRIRAGTVSSDDKNPETAMPEVLEASVLAISTDPELRKAAAIERLTASLRELGLADAEVDECAADISDIISKVMAEQG